MPITAHKEAPYREGYEGEYLDRNVATLDALNDAYRSMEIACDRTWDLSDECVSVAEKIDHLRAYYDIDSSAPCPKDRARYLTSLAIAACGKALDAWREADDAHRGHFKPKADAELETKRSIANLLLAKTRLEASYPKTEAA